MRTIGDSRLLVFSKKSLRQSYQHASLSVSRTISRDVKLGLLFLSENLPFSSLIIHSGTPQTVPGQLIVYYRAVFWLEISSIAVKTINNSGSLCVKSPFRTKIRWKARWLRYRAKVCHQIENLVVFRLEELAFWLFVRAGHSRALVRARVAHCWPAVYVIESGTLMPGVARARRTNRAITNKKAARKVTSISLRLTLSLQEDQEWWSLVQ